MANPERDGSSSPQAEIDSGDRARALLVFMFRHGVSLSEILNRDGLLVFFSQGFVEFHFEDR